MESNKSVLTVIIVIIVLLILGILGYFMLNGNTNNNVTEDNAAENTTNDNNEYDYDTNADNTSVAGSYSSDADDSVIEDAKEAVTTKDDMELKLDSEGAAVVGLKDNVLKGTYTSDASKVTVVTTKDEEGESKTYEFTINDDNSLTYTKDDNTKITLKKVDSNKLNYIKSTD